MRQPDGRRKKSAHYSDAAGDTQLKIGGNRHGRPQQRAGLMEAVANQPETGLAVSIPVH